MSRRARSALLLSVTLTDFVLTLFFLLLLLAAWALLRKDETIRTLEGARDADRRQIERLHEDVRSLETRVAIVREIFEKVPEASRPELERLILVALRDAKRLAKIEAENRELAATKRSLEATRTTLEHEISRLEQQVATLAGSAASSCPAELASAQKARDDAVRQGRYCFERLAKTGFGKKPCWVDANGKIEYAFAVTITEGVISVAPSWPPARAADAQQIPGLAGLAGTWPAPEFAARAAPILAWSEEKDCRHFVTIDDQATSKAAFKRNLLAVEGYFYKRLLDEAKARSDPAPAVAGPEPAQSPAGEMPAGRASEL